MDTLIWGQIRSRHILYLSGLRNSLRVKPSNSKPAGRLASGVPTGSHRPIQRANSAQGRGSGYLGVQGFGFEVSGFRV